MKKFVGTFLVFIILLLTSCDEQKVKDIFEAIYKNDKAQVNRILDKNPGLVYSLNKNEFTPLLFAEMNDKVEIAELLITRGSPLNATDVSSGLAPIHLAAKYGYRDIVKMLIARGASMNIKDNRGFTALHWAAFENRKETALVLLIRGAYANPRDNDGFTPLGIALMKNNTETADAIRQYGGIE